MVSLRVRTGLFSFNQRFLLPCFARGSCPRALLLYQTTGAVGYVREVLPMSCQMEEKMQQVLSSLQGTAVVG